jgi:hypothetical protein
MEQAVKVPLRERINLRMIIFACVVLFLVGAPLYIFLNEELTGGIEQTGDMLKVDLKAMGNFPFDPSNSDPRQVPQKYRELDGKRVQLTGQIYAPDEAGEFITHFQIVYSIAKCCFGGPPKVQERVFGYTMPGKKIPYPRADFAEVTGVMHVTLKREGGVVSEVYSMDVEDIKPLG